MRRRIVLVTLALLAGGCTVGQDYARPKVDVPPSWRIDAGTADELVNAVWWRQFDDPVLDRLIEQALANNSDLLIAAARVEQFLGQLTTTRSQFFPQIGYGLDASRSRSSRVGAPPLPAGADPYTTLFNGALSAQWQIDLFGRIRRQTEAAQAQVYASEQGRRGVVLTVVAGVAAGYIVLRGLDRQLEIAHSTAKNYADTKRIMDRRFKGGVAAAVQAEQATSQYEQALAAIPAIEQQIAAQENLMSVLLGANPSAVPRGRTIDQLLAPPVPGALPSSLLERRPDILQAEQNLVAANANVGVAQSLYYPQLSLTGLSGSTSAVLGDFLSSASLAWTAAAALTGPIVTFGAIEGQVASAEGARREALAIYQRVILNAFRETNDALVGASKKRDAFAAQGRRVTALREYARLSTLKWDNGYADYLEVLYAQNELFAAELAAVASQVESLTQLVAVYSALGGGWVDMAAARAPAVLQGAASAATR